MPDRVGNWRYRAHTIDLTNARATPELLNMQGRCVYAIAGGLNALVNIFIDEQNQDPMPLGTGQGWTGTPFSRLYITNAAQVGVSITIMTTDNPDFKPLLNPSNANVQFKGLPGVCQVYPSNAGVAARSSVMTITPGSFEVLMKHLYISGAGVTVAVVLEKINDHLGNPQADPIEANKTVVANGPDHNILYSVPTLVVAAGDAATASYPTNAGGTQTSAYSAAVSTTFGSLNNSANTDLNPVNWAAIFPRIPLGHRLVVKNTNQNSILALFLTAFDNIVGVPTLVF